MFRKRDTCFDFIEMKEDKFIENNKLKDLKFRRFLAIQNFFRLTKSSPRVKENIIKIINYSSELSYLTILKNNNLIDEQDFFKIKNKIMQDYGVKSELMI